MNVSWYCFFVDKQRFVAAGGIQQRLINNIHLTYFSFVVNPKFQQINTVETMENKKRSKLEAIADPVTRDPIVHLKGLVTSIHEQFPTHEMFGTPKPNEICMPYDSTRKGGQCWLNAMGNLGKELKEADVRYGENKCWMSTQSALKIASEGARPKSVLRTRLLAFLKEPTDLHWQWLKEGGNAIAHPFDHYCGRGQPVSEQATKICVNGLEHGEFSVRNDNESRKLCKNGALCLCPGHGPNNTKCIFTHPDGSLRVCRMKPDCVPVCHCIRPCFGL